MKEALREKRIRWFSLGVTIVLIVVCNALLLGGLWASGLNLDVVFSDSELYDPSSGHCVKLAWAKVIGVEGPVRVCSEWLDMSDPTGQVHAIRQGESLAMGGDGNLYYENDRKGDFRLLALLVFVGVVIFSGVRVKPFLIARYRRRLSEIENRATRPSS
ncbi:MAG: hypothetical protein ACE1ZE_08585 [Candidatus Binatia bacterium]